MSEIADRYRRLSDAFAERIAAVPADRWDAPSPCEGWTALDVVRHVVESQSMFLGLVGRDGPAEVPRVEDDALGAWRIASAAIQAGLDDPARARETFVGYFGEQTFEQAVDRFLNFDLVVHGWDLARATGLDDRIDPADVERLAAVAEGFGDAMRGPRAFGPALEVPADADAQDRLLAFLGRPV